MQSSRGSLICLSIFTVATAVEVMESELNYIIIGVIRQKKKRKRTKPSTSFSVSLLILVCLALVNGQVFVFFMEWQSFTCWADRRFWMLHTLQRYPDTHTCSLSPKL